MGDAKLRLRLELSPQIFAVALTGKQGLVGADDRARLVRGFLASSMR